MMKTMVISSTSMSMLFTQMKHPMAMGMITMMQTMLTCTISGMMNQKFWFPYILFLVFLGGMLVLFMYMTSLASNEMMFLSMKLSAATTIMTTMMFMMSMEESSTWTYEHELSANEKTNLMLEKFYNQPTGSTTLMLALYLLLTLIVVAKITNISEGPLRKSK
uniref:NADH-ubiquinone oxidoreductase chain 6 n=1 Tax=Zootermopsis angusticollis TaxID=7503 RepID=I6UA51_ZOOAN|nr:NADH dehydrogenase subunit 6 [Zootermopsis angusticollis]AFM92432.1 NADH dehydrogenase subunit 6 [Zootermopsis angusticollis]